MNADAASALQPFVNQRTVLLTTYRRDGTPVGTLVNIAVDGERAFVRTFDKAWKLKRIRNNPVVEIAPSTVRGKPTGPRFALAPECLAAMNRCMPAKPLTESIPCCTEFSSRSRIVCAATKRHTSS